ncbi:MAG TPA: TolC family protein [Chitinophagaceae bacterium]|nr:TolC family protein [Chitinophagaceae bacterium]
MKKSIIIFFLFPAFLAGAQVNPGARGGIIAQVTDIREKLVELALQNPDNEIADLNIQTAGYELKSAKWAWLNEINVSGNLNEYSIQPQYSQYALLYPKYNFGVLIPLGSFGTKSMAVKEARNKVAVERANKENVLRQIRAETLTKYEDYIMYKQLYTLQVQRTDDANTNLGEAQKKFSNGEIPIEDFNQASDGYNAELVKKIMAFHDLEVARYALEKLIGTDLDSVMGTQ